MAERPEFRRLPKYFYYPPNFVESLGQERFNELFGEAIKLTFTNTPFFSRIFLKRVLWEFHNNPELPRTYHYTEEDILNSIVYLQTLATTFGVLLGEEIESIQSGKEPETVNPAPKYLTWQELSDLSTQWAEEKKVVGLCHGAFDPPHVGHSRLFISVWPYCDVLLVGFDKNTMIRKRKGENRPRFPQLAWRMWELALLPTVDYVFVLPPDEPENEKYEEIYKHLGIKVMGTDESNPLLPEYERRLKKLGGKVITTSSGRERVLTSTKMFTDLSNSELSQYQSMKSLLSRAKQMEEVALVAGYLRDYPQGT